MKIFGALLVMLTMLTSCRQKTQSEIDEIASNPEYLHKSLENLTHVIVHDIFSPPVASRLYAYPSIAAYEVLSATDSNYQSLSGKLEGFNGLQSSGGQNSNTYLTGTLVFNYVARELVFSEEKIDDFLTEMKDEWKALGIPTKTISASEVDAEELTEEMLLWMNGDMYKETRTFPKFAVDLEDDGRWKPTPPAYKDGIEPHWNRIRPMVLDSATQFKPAEPPRYSLDEESDFFRELNIVKEAVDSADEEEVEIAAFWDCNPFVVNTTGHMMFATKKITPGGHWMGIAQIACKKDEADIMRSAEAYALTSIALFDGFISCWDEKYRSSLIRPETVINEHIDADWRPHLQTPPFPEHTSGHSVVSAAAAITLTSLFGDNFAYEDDVELEYGLPVRSFRSFIQASEEAAISRLYGGIHYMPAIDDGVKQGRAVGDLVVEKVQTRYKK